MTIRPYFSKSIGFALKALAVLIAIEMAGVSVVESTRAEAIPERCAGYGELRSMSMTDWESGMGSWTASTLSVANPAVFATPDWAVAGNLPDGRQGNAAWVENLVLGDCVTDDQSGVLRLVSPEILIPNDYLVSRISITHWFQTEFGWDGGNFKIKVGGGPFKSIPSSAIETTPYNEVLYPALDEFGLINNTNPLAEQAAFTGTIDGQSTADWVWSRINLLGLVQPGDRIRLAIDFGLDECTIADQVPAPVGWYIDEVEFYSCEAELASSSCGNGVIDGGEQCDDGNDFIDDGCSNTCQVESGWQCTNPTAPGTILDPSFEAGRNNPNWAEASTNSRGSPICDAAVCGLGGSSGPSDGTYWVWLGGFTTYQEGSVSQSVVIPTTARQLRFDFEAPFCDSPSDYVEVLIDGNQELLVDGSSPLCGIFGYQKVDVDVTAYADGGTHNIEFHSETFAANGFVSNFFIDVVELPGNPSMCRRNGTSLTLLKTVINDDGGEAQSSDWTLIAAGPSGFSGTGPMIWGGTPFTAGTYNLSETGGPSHYDASDWICEDGTQIDENTVSVALGEAVTCTIINNDTPSTLTVEKNIDNSDGGTITDPNAFALTVDGKPVLDRVVNEIDYGDHTVSETSLEGYIPGPWGGDCDAAGNITLALGQNATCSITNDDIPSANLSISKTDNLTTAAPGGVTTYSIIVSNTGPSTVHDALVTDNFTADLNCTYTSVANGGVSGNTASDSGDIADTLVMPAGSFVTYTVPCDIDVDATGSLSNSVSVNSAVADPNPGNESASDTTDLVASADLSISKTDNQTSAAPGGSATYKIVVANAGPSDVNSASMTDVFTADLSCTYTSVAAGGASGNSSSGTGDISDTLVLPAGSSVTYTAPCIIAADASGTLSNTANISTAVIDPNPGNESATDFTNLTATADLAISKTDGQTSATSGGNTTYTIVVSNAGPSTVDDANVIDNFPAELDCSYTSAEAGGASGNTAAGNNDIDDTLVMPTGSSVTYTALCQINPGATGSLSNTASVDSVVMDPNPGNESATDTTDLTTAADLSITKTDGQTTTTPGSSTIYTIVVSNAGPSLVNGASVIDNFGTDLECVFVSTANGGAGGNTASGTGDIADTLLLPPGGSVTYTALCQVDSGATGSLSNTASVNSAVMDPSPGNDSATDINDLVASADLTISKTDGQTSAAPGGDTTYTIVVTNAGPSDVDSASMTDAFASALSCSYTSAAAGGASGNTASGSGDIADTLALPAGSSVTYTVPCDIEIDVTESLSNTASVNSATDDSNPGNNSATDTNDLLASADLSISKTDGQTSAAPGGSATYTIVVANAGPSNVNNASMTDAFTADLSCTYTSVAAGGASGNSASGTGDISDTLLLPVGSSVTYTAPCVIAADATGTLSNTANISSAAIDPNPGNESATDFTNLTASADLSISKTDNQTSATSGGSTTYTIVVSNAGPSTVNDAGVTDSFPAELDCSYTSAPAGGASGHTAAGSGDIADTLVLPAGSSVTYTALCEIDPGATGTLSNTASVNSVVMDPNSGNESDTDTTDLTTAADLSISKTDGQTSAVPGGGTTYSIVVVNNGPSIVNSASVADSFVSELDCSYTSSAAGGASGNTASGNGDINDILIMPAGSSVTYMAPCQIDPGAVGSLSNTASVDSALMDPNPGNESATDTTELTASADLSISKTDGQTSTTPGGSTTYTIVVNNAGPSVVSNASVTDNFGSDLDCTFTSVAAGGASGNTDSGNGNIADNLVMPPGSSVTYTVPCQIDPDASGILSNTASVGSAIDDPVPGNDSSTDTSDLVASADLSISKTDNQSSAAPGGVTTYSIVVSNAGPSTVNNAAATDNFAAELDCSYTSVASGGASGHTASGNGDISDTLVLPPGGSVTYTAPCQIDPDATGTLSNTASVSSAADDPVPGNESATDSTELATSADLSISKTDGLAQVTPGGNTTYTIVVSNAGPSTVNDASVADSFATELDCTFTSVAANGASGNTASGSGDITDTLVLPPGGSVTYTAPCQIDSDATGTLTNTASVSSSADDPEPGNDSATDNSELAASADLSITKSDGIDQATAGSSTTYTIVVSNAGPSAVSDANVTDNFPATLDCSYSSAPAGGASGNTASGTGDIGDTLFLPVASSVTYTAVCQIDPGATGTLSNTASVSSAAIDPLPGNESAMDTSQLVASANLTISKKDGRTSVTPGGRTTYRIVVRNAGPSAVSDANVTDSFAAIIDCSYTSTATGGASGNTASGNGDISDILVMPPGSSVTYQAPCEIDSDAIGILSNTASVNSATEDPVPGNESATDTGNLVASADLSINKTDGQTSVAPGGVTTYTIVVNNAGPSTVSNASLSDSFAAELDCGFTSAASGGAGGNTASGNGDISDTLVLPPGSSVTYTAPCQIDPGATGTLSNTASVSAPAFDPEPGNESATDTSELVISADLSISKSDGQTTAAPGNLTTYTIVVSNSGPSAVNDASVTDNFTAELDCSYTSAAAGGASGNTVSGTGNIADTLVLPADSSVTYTAPCQIDPGATGTLSNTASISSTADDPAPGNESATDNSELVTSADLSITKSDGLDEVTPGGSTTYTIVVGNAGPSAVSDASVTDNFTAGLDCSYTSVAAGGASGNTASGTGNIADTLVLPAGSSVTYTAPCQIDPGATGTLSNTASISSTADDPAPGNESATDNSELVTSADLSITKSDGLDEVTPGGSTTYTIVVGNAGPSAVSDAILSDSFAAELSCSYTSVAAGGASGNTASGTGNIADTLVLPPGGSVTYMAPCQIDPGATGTLSNTASVNSQATDPSPGNENATDTSELVASADLSITKSDGLDQAAPGGSTTYTILVGNAGPSAVSDANVADSFAAELECSYTSLVSGGASGNTASGNGDISDTLVIQPGSSVTYTASCQIDPAATGTLTNIASVSSALDDPAPGNETATDTSELVASADLSISKTDGQTSAEPGAVATYTIVVSNAGPSTVNDASVTDSFESNLDCTFSSVAAGGATGNAASGTGDIGDTLVLPADSSVTYTAFCQIDSGATGILTNTATVDSATDDPVPGNESATDTSDLVSSADLSITKSDGQDEVTPGGTTTYSIIINNAGPSTVNDASVTDSFESNLVCTFTSVAAGGASGNTASGDGDIADTLVMPPGSSVTYTAPCEIDPDAMDILTNTASVSSAADDPVPGNENATDTSELVPSADLSITKTDGQNSATAGGTTTYTIVVSNAGPSTVNDANVTDNFAEELDCTYTSVVAGGASGNTASGSGDIVDTLELPPGSSVVYTVPCNIDAEATDILTNTATVSSAVNDPNPGDESAMDSSNLTASADLEITKTDGQTVATPGGSTTYTIVVGNAGPSTVNDAIVTDSFATGLDCSFSSVVTGGASGNTASGTGDIADTLVLPAGSSVTYTAPCEIDPDLDGVLSNTATVSSVAEDPFPGNESATDTSELTASADLSITKTDGRTSVTTGESTTYTIVVRNSGPSTVIDAAVTDSFVPELDCSYTSEAAGGASGNSASGNGNIADTLVLPSDSSVTYSVPCKVDPDAVTGTLSNTADVTSEVSDPNPGDESATDDNSLISDVIHRDGFES